MARRRRGWPRFAAAVIVTLAVFGSSVWQTLPNWRPPLHQRERYGIDVSHHQGDIDWRAVRDDGIEFAFIKATQGATYIDPRFRTNWEAARAAGVVAGAYHFFSLCSSGQAQAEHFVSVAPPAHDAFGPAVDLELAGNCAQRPPAGRVTTELASFLRVVGDAWASPVIVYARDDWTDRYPSRLPGQPRWRFRLLRRPSNDWLLWQVGGYAHVNGVDGRVDLDVAAAPKLVPV